MGGVSVQGVIIASGSAWWALFEQPHARLSVYEHHLRASFFKGMVVPCASRCIFANTRCAASKGGAHWCNVTLPFALGFLVHGYRESEAPVGAVDSVFLSAVPTRHGGFDGRGS